MSTNAPTESKVWGATVGGGAGATITAFLLWIAGVFIWGVTGDASSAGAAIAAVPLPVAGLVTGVVTVGGAYFGGWWAKHTPRPVPEYEPKRELVEDTSDVEEGQSWRDSPESQDEGYPVPEYAPADIDVETDNKEVER